MCVFQDMMRTETIILVHACLPWYRQPAEEFTRRSLCTRFVMARSLGSNAYAGHKTEAAEFFQLSRADFEAVIERYPVLRSRLNTIAEDNMRRVKKAQSSMMFKLKSGIKNMTGSCFKKTS